MKTGRVIEAHRTNIIVRSGEQTYTATVRGAFHVEGAFPKVGDYIRFTELGGGQAVVHEIRPRTSVIKRKAADSDEEQIIAANVDLMIIVMGLDGDFNPSRLERYLLLAKQSDIAAVVVLNKLDIASAPKAQIASATTISKSTPVLPLSALSGEGMQALSAYLPKGATAVLLGSSGAGKSTLTNQLLDTKHQMVGAVRDGDSRGRHVTTSRHLFELPNGAFLIDTPGMRELGVLSADTDDQRRTFAHVEELAAQCRFRNCDHDKSAGCAVLAALRSGELSEREWRNYQKLMQEQRFQGEKTIKNRERYSEQNTKRQAQHRELQRRRRLSGR